MRPYILLLPALALLSGCEELREFSPRVSFSRLDVQEIDFERIDANFVFDVANPNPVGVRLDRFSYNLELQQVELLDGAEPEGLALPAAGSAQVSVPASLIWQGIWDTIQATRGEDEVDFGLDGTFGFDTDWGPLDIPYRADGRFPALRRPKIDLGRLRVQQLDLVRGTALVTLDLNVDNDHASGMTFERLDYALSLGGRRVADGLIPDLGVVDGATTQTLTAPLTIDLVQAGGSVVDLLSRGGQVQAGLDATVDVQTPFGLIPLGIDERGDITVQR